MGRKGAELGDRRVLRSVTGDRGEVAPPLGSVSDTDGYEEARSTDPDRGR